MNENRVTIEGSGMEQGQRKKVDALDGSDSDYDTDSDEESECVTTGRIEEQLEVKR